MSFLSITFSSESGQAVLPPSLSELQALSGISGTTLELQGAPPSLSELQALSGTSGTTLELQGAPPSFSELEALK